MTDYSFCFDTTDALPLDTLERPYRVQSRLVSSLSVSVIPPRRPVGTHDECLAGGRPSPLKVTMSSFYDDGLLVLL